MVKAWKWATRRNGRVWSPLEEFMLTYLWIGLITLGSGIFLAFYALYFPPFTRLFGSLREVPVTTYLEEVAVISYEMAYVVSEQRVVLLVLLPTLLVITIGVFSKVMDYLADMDDQRTKGNYVCTDECCMPFKTASGSQYSRDALDTAIDNYGSREN